jgi:hypothetical protein
MTEPSASEVVCASCGNPASGRFCSNCGASLESGVCAGCGETLSPGARFCHSCGRAQRPVPNDVPSGAASKSGPPSSLPWIAAAIASIALLAYLAGSAYNRRSSSAPDASQNALPQSGVADQPVRAPDISQMSPEEQADRLYNRVMALDRRGKTDSVLFFAPMAIEAYRMLTPLSTDQRYDLGRIAEVAGALPLARVQADTILLESPANLLGLTLGARIAQLEKRASDARKFETALLDAYAAESARKLPEYERHKDDIESALVRARRSPRK